MQAHDAVNKNYGAGMLTKIHTSCIIVLVIEEPEGGWRFPPKGGDLHAHYHYISYS